MLRLKQEAREIADRYNVKSAKSELSDEQLKLRRISELITAYEKIVEGNYFDDLIKAQREQKQTKTAIKRI